VQAAAAAALSLMLVYRKGETRKSAAEWIAEVLTEGGYQFGGKRTNKAAAVAAWRRDFSLPSAKRTERVNAYFSYVEMYKTLKGTNEQKYAAVKALFVDLVARAGYGTVVP
jgi:hypothetical protein